MGESEPGNRGERRKREEEYNEKGRREEEYDGEERDLNSDGGGKEEYGKEGSSHRFSGLFRRNSSSICLLQRPQQLGG